MIRNITRTWGSKVSPSSRRWAATHPSTTSTNSFAILLRGFSSNANTNTPIIDGLVKTEINDNSATLTLNRPPVNSLSLEMCTAISTSIKTLEDIPKIKSVIISSSSPTFSAGLDLTELYRPSPERLRQFWTSFQQLFLDLYGSRLATVGAINGHAPAAGCMIALACDYRVMVQQGGGVIGLNESKFGIVAPPWLGQLMLRTVGFRRGEMALALGTLFKPQDAFDIGLVDRLVDDPDELMTVCQNVAEEWGAIPSHARESCKLLAREEFIHDLLKNREKDLEYFCNFITNEKVQAGLGAYLESLKKK